MFSRPRTFPRMPLRLLPGARPLSGADKPPPPLREPPVPPLPPAYHQLDNLDFTTAAKILFTEPPKKKKFGFDFHLVQFFFACMPSLAVYLVAQYARYEIRRMEAEVEKKKQVEEEQKAKEAELAAEEEESKLSNVLVRLDTLEETVREIVDNKKISGTDSSEAQHGDKKENSTTVDNNSDPKSKFKLVEPTSDSRKETISSVSPPVNVIEDKNQDMKTGEKKSSSGETKR
ncbi:hypothetical protein J5N97_002662 [Dioscorea zingiberensis]|uniref:Uncharacterized protein n=1 Tax=Dioscorea zingiberensis TaxID=325984 RepID=A0A9D5D2P8_9LILI|nr:hypothetical protein J5N97_002662 [Dioscorea zingiberensis]